MMTIEQIKKKRKLWLDNNIDTSSHYNKRKEQRHVHTHTLTQYDDVVECQMNKTYIVLNKTWLPSSLTGCYDKRA